VKPEKKYGNQRNFYLNFNLKHSLDTEFIASWY